MLLLFIRVLNSQLWSRKLCIFVCFSCVLSMFVSIMPCGFFYFLCVSLKQFHLMTCVMPCTFSVRVSKPSCRFHETFDEPLPPSLPRLSCFLFHALGNSMYGIRVCVCVLLRLLFFRAHSKQTKIPRFYCYFFLLLIF